MGGADKKDWPNISGVLLIDKRDKNNKIEKGKGNCPRLPRQCILAGTPRNDELLGGHKSNLILGNEGDDVLWGDHVEVGNHSEGARSASDVISGGPGNDYIYGSHGVNYIDAGKGDDTIRVHFGRGLLDCGPGKDFYHVARSRRENYKFLNCERVSYQTEK